MEWTFLRIRSLDNNYRLAPKIIRPFLQPQKGCPIAKGFTSQGGWVLCTGIHTHPYVFMWISHINYVCPFFQVKKIIVDNSSKMIWVPSNENF